ncbi:hypothetical protein VTK56DRAFT_7722 [Thermocarpiscus australiensis]
MQEVRSIWSSLPVLTVVLACWASVFEHLTTGPIWSIPSKLARVKASTSKSRREPTIDAPADLASFVLQVFHCSNFWNLLKAPHLNLPSAGLSPIQNCPNHQTQSLTSLPCLGSCFLAKVGTEVVPGPKLPYYLGTTTLTLELRAQRIDFTKSGCAAPCMRHTVSR